MEIEQLVSGLLDFVMDPDPTKATAAIALVIAVGLQALKDRLGLPGTAIKVLAIALGAGTAVAISMALGETDLASWESFWAGLEGAAIPSGYYALFIKGTKVGVKLQGAKKDENAKLPF